MVANKNLDLIKESLKKDFHFWDEDNFFEFQCTEDKIFQVFFEDNGNVLRVCCKYSIPIGSDDDVGCFFGNDEVSFNFAVNIQHLINCSLTPHDKAQILNDLIFSYQSNSALIHAF